MLSYKSVRPYTFARLDEPAVLPDDARTDMAPLEPATMVVAAPELPDIEAIVREAHEAGFRQGYTDGLERIEADQREATARLAALATAALTDAESLVHDLERRVVELSLAIARKVIEREVTTDPALVLRVAHAALDEMDKAASVVVHVHPEDHGLVVAHWDEVVPAPLAERARLVADEGVERGGCVLTTGHGQADAQPSAKLEQIGTIFDQLLEGGAS